MKRIIPNDLLDYPPNIQKSPLEKWKSDVKEFIDSSCEPEDYPDDPDCFKLRNRTAKQCLDDAFKLIQYIEENYKRELRTKPAGELYKWQQKLIEKKHRLQRIFDVIGYIKQHTIPPMDSIKLANQMGIEPFKKENGREIQYVLFTPDYDRMQLKLGISKRQIQKYLRALSQMESKILRDLGKQSPRGNKVYGVGYWGRFLDKRERISLKRNFFLKNTAAVRRDLMNLKLEKSNAGDV